jgi:hypothetical protein
MALQNNILVGPNPDINLGAYKGPGIVQEFKFTVTQADIAGLGAFLTGDVILFNLPPRGYVTHTLLKPTTLVAGPSISACTAQIQSQSGNHSVALDVFTGPVSGTLFDVYTPITQALIKPTNITLVNPVMLHFIAVGANLSVATAGQIDVVVGYRVIQS